MVKVKLSKVLEDFHAFIIENNYNKESNDSHLVATEFMGLTEDQEIQEL